MQKLIPVSLLLCTAIFCHPLLAQNTDGNVEIFSAGCEDNFALPTEPVTVRPELAFFIDDFLGHPIREFDEGGSDKTFAYTFSSLDCKIRAACLEIGLRASDTLSENDTFCLDFRPDFVPGEESAWAWGQSIASIVGYPWNPGATTTLYLDLGNLPPDPHGRTSVLDDLQDGVLDVVVDDDTAVDYIILRLYGGAVPVQEQSWGGVKALYR